MENQTQALSARPIPLVESVDSDQGPHHEARANLSQETVDPSHQMYGIHRVGLGWSVSLVREGTRYAKFFSGPLLGSDKRALEAAQMWRNSVVQAVPPQTRVQRASKLRSTNTSGISGVSCEYGPDGNIKLWIAQTRIGPDNNLRKTFGVRRYGLAAFEMAVEERSRQLLQMEGLAHVHRAEKAIREGELTSPPNVKPVIVKEQIKRSNNSTGVPGVVPRRGPDGQVKYWLARTLVNGETWSDCFAVAEHGDEGARELAILARENQLKRKASLTATLTSST